MEIDNASMYRAATYKIRRAHQCYSECGKIMQGGALVKSRKCPTKECVNE